MTAKFFDKKPKCRRNYRVEKPPLTDYQATACACCIVCNLPSHLCVPQKSIVKVSSGKVKEQYAYSMMDE